MATVAFLGTGLLGGGMVEGMLSRGDAVTVWNRTDCEGAGARSLGAQVAATPGDAVAAPTRVHMTLPDDAVVDEMMTAAIPTPAAGRHRRRSLDHSPRRRRHASRAWRTPG